jgi:DNA-binding transcriptional regulator YiaG
MDQDQFRFALDKLGLTQVGAAHLLNVNERTLRRWATGDQPVPLAVAYLLAIMIRHKITPEMLARYIR